MLSVESIQKETKEEKKRATHNREDWDVLRDGSPYKAEPENIAAKYESEYWNTSPKERRANPVP